MERGKKLAIVILEHQIKFLLLLHPKQHKVRMKISNLGVGVKSILA